jgi:cyclopropane fatty-acyl-phospholipid synthase-like methyltransferase
MSNEIGDRPENREDAFRSRLDEGDPTGRKRHAPDAARNTNPISTVLLPRIPTGGHVLEIGSGSGQHFAAFIQERRDMQWQPSDVSHNARQSQQALIEEFGLHQVETPVAVDLLRPDWPASFEQKYDVIVCINVIHISPWQVCENLLSGAGKLLRPGGELFLYGPYKRDGRHTAASNEQFDQSLRQRDSKWGVRDLTVVTASAEKTGLMLKDVVDMPANNLSVIFRSPRD